ncbi:uncharacterized protein LOC143890959 [Tasmannia lanceolata]|uniref:uncharacterized protein LOC143890959 n=1 Tax=Tasmannia lanceolata TaxID=3420 RepID=UPI0040632139
MVSSGFSKYFSLKLNADASLANGEGSIGGLLRNSNGNHVSLYSIDYPAASLCSSSISELEIEAIFRGLQLVDPNRCNLLWIVSDSLVAVKVLQKEITCPWRKIITLEKIELLLTSFRSWTISHIWREGNKAADYLSKTTCPLKGHPINAIDLPQELLSIVLEDSSGAIYFRM